MSPDESNALKNAIDQFSSSKVLVIGDLIIDHFIWGSVSRISPEAPVPVVNVTHDNLMLGGSANVLHNLHSLGSKSSICGIIGDDAMGGKIVELISDLGSPADGVLKAHDRPTTIKTRIIAHNQQVVRFDRENTVEIDGRFRKILYYYQPGIDQSAVSLLHETMSLWRRRKNV